jgi:hypothetical protein
MFSLAPFVASLQLNLSYTYTHSIKPTHTQLIPLYLSNACVNMVCVFLLLFGRGVQWCKISEKLAIVHDSTFRAVELVHYTCARCREHVLHFHGFQNEQRLVLSYRVALFYQQAQYLTLWIYV